MLLSTQLCSAVPASEDVSVGTHTRLTSGLKACISMQLFMPFKCCKSKRHTGRVGNGQTSCHSDENIALCAAEQLGWRGREDTGSSSRRSEAPVDSKGSFPGSGQAGVLMIPHQQPAVPGISFSGISTVPPASSSSSSFTSLPHLIILRVSAMWQTNKFIVYSRGVRVPDLHYLLSQYCICLSHFSVHCSRDIVIAIFQFLSLEAFSQWLGDLFGFCRGTLLIILLTMI